MSAKDRQFIVMLCVCSVAALQPDFEVVRMMGSVALLIVNLFALRDAFK